MIKIFNSFSNKLEDFKPIKKGEVSMYVCGPTVYDKLHIGNTRPVVFFDVVARAFEYFGYKVIYASNFTDIDDKIINKAKELGITEKELSDYNVKLAYNTYKKLNIRPHDYNPRVTENMENIINFIKLLKDKGYAYEAGDDIYFSVGKIANYGILSGQAQDKLQIGARIDVEDKKENPADFTLWKKTDEGITWCASWGDGRPGWHTECVVMIDSIFKGPIDIHGGGMDLKFPHHDNEIAQAEAAYNHRIANYWMHNGRLNMQGTKMSKSLGNLIWADDLLDEVGYGPFRILILTTHYRQPLEYSDQILKQAVTDYERIYRTYFQLFRKVELANGSKRKVKDQELLEIRSKFQETLKNDFNTPNAITEIYSLVKVVNNALRDKSTSLEFLEMGLSLFDELLDVLGLNIEMKKLTIEEKELVNKWQDARNKKDFETADKLRAEMNERGIIV